MLDEARAKMGEPDGHYVRKSIRERDSELLRLFEEGYTQKQLAAAYGMKQSAVGAALSRQRKREEDARD